jgi:hypothetical protein
MHVHGAIGKEGLQAVVDNTVDMPVDMPDGEVMTDAGIHMPTGTEAKHIGPSGPGVHSYV